MRRRLFPLRQSRPARRLGIHRSPLMLPPCPAKGSPAAPTDRAPAAVKPRFQGGILPIYTAVRRGKSGAESDSKHRLRQQEEAARIAKGRRVGCGLLTAFAKKEGLGNHWFPSRFLGPFVRKQKDLARRRNHPFPARRRKAFLLRRELAPFGAGLKGAKRPPGRAALRCCFMGRLSPPGPPLPDRGDKAAPECGSHPPRRCGRCRIPPARRTAAPPARRRREQSPAGQHAAWTGH